MKKIDVPVIFLRCMMGLCCLLSASVWAVDTDGDGIDDVGGVTIYSTSFDTADAGWSFGQWSRVNDAAARTPSYVATACTMGIIQCRFPPVMTLAYTLPQASRISFWAKSSSNSGTTVPFYVDNVQVGYFGANKYSYTQSSFLVSAGAHVFKWTISSPTSFGQPYIDDVSITTVTDNCPAVPNADQLDVDQDGLGDVCDPDSDNDGVLDGADNCPLNSNADQLNTDGDAQGNACDSDDDNDGAPDGNDRWPLNPAASVDADADGFPDRWTTGCDVACQTGSGLQLDNCPATSNPDQLDSDGDGTGNACDPDIDGDGVANAQDNCTLLPNPDQKNTDGDVQGDACDVLPVRADKVVQLAAGYQFSCILTAAGGAKCWGHNDYGDLGYGGNSPQYRPVDVVGLTSGVQSISVGIVGACAVTEAGGLKCWGNNGNGQLGDGTKTHRNAPVDVVGLDSGVAAVAVGESHTCALMTGGTVKCWGAISTPSVVPVDVPGLTGVLAITAGGAHHCALMMGGAVKCWGYGAWGEIGDGGTVGQLSPTDVSGLGSGVAAIDNGYVTSCASTVTGGLKCWGHNGSGEVGNGTATVTITTPVDVSGLTSGVTGFGIGYYHSCAVLADGSARCWGYNNNGQLGNGLTSNSNVPVAVNGIGNDSMVIAPGYDHTCSLTTSGSVKCWGNNTYGQLGDNTVVSKTTPQVVPGLYGDTDNDGIGNNADPDDDNDGIPDYIDADSLNAAINTEKLLPMNSNFRGSAIGERINAQ
ncbi:MAG TPA: thrombospondin type 3 repeat-containing protein [Pseudomonadales bacterium]|nr:thrombospondin type 3 repeat-containing protein [Pseudomonadales bacterium]